MPDIGYC